MDYENYLEWTQQDATHSLLRWISPACRPPLTLHVPCPPLSVWPAALHIEGPDCRPLPLSPLSALQGVPGNGASREGLDANLGGGLELGGSVDGEAQGQDEDEAGTREAPGDLGSALDVAEGAELKRVGVRRGWDQSRFLSRERSRAAGNLSEDTPKLLMIRHDRNHSPSRCTQCACEIAKCMSVGRVHLDEGAGQEESVRQADLHSAQQRGNASAVSGQSGQVRCHDRGRGDGGLQHSNEGISVDGLDNLGLRGLWRTKRC